MIDDMLKTKFLISIASELDAEDFDRLDELHELAMSTEERDFDLTGEITELYNKYRRKDVNQDIQQI